MTGVRGAGARAFQWLGLGLLAAVTLVLCYLALTKETAADSGLVRDDSSPAASQTSPPADQPSATGSPAGEAEVKVPKVPDQRFADFTKGDELPDGSKTYDSPGNTGGLQVTGQGLTHGPVRDGSVEGVGLVETALESDVRSLGFRVRFPEQNSGSAVLMAWESSAVAALDSGDPLPSGMRLVGTPGTWTLSFLSAGGEQVLAEGVFVPDDGSLEFRLVRDGDEIFVVDPTGLATATTKTRTGDLIGPFAAWGLTESGPKQAPAVIEAVWAG